MACHTPPFTSETRAVSDMTCLAQHKKTTGAQLESNGFRFKGGIFCDAGCDANAKDCYECWWMVNPGRRMRCSEGKPIIVIDRPEKKQHSSFIFFSHTIKTKSQKAMDFMIKKRTFGPQKW